MIFWIKMSDNSSEKIEHGGNSPILIPPIIRRSIENEEVVNVFGPYPFDAAPATIADCSNDKKLKG